MKHLLLLLLCSLLTASVFAETVTVSGRLVSNSDNDPLSFATVAVADEASPDVFIQRFAAGVDGEFSTTLYPGTYIFMFHFMGMAELQKNIEVLESQNPLYLGVIGVDEDAGMLAEVSVLAQRPLVRVEIDRITYDVQADPEASTSNVLDMMRRVPLLTVDGEDNIQLRGSSNFRIHLNGRPSNMISNNPREALRSMPASNILRIEVITEPGVRYEAEGVGGIINIITNRRVDDGYSGTIGARGNTFGGFGGNTSLNLRRGMFGFSGNLSYNRHRQPESTTWSEREDFYPLADNIFTQEGTNRGSGGGMWGSGMLSFEPDTVNLFSASFNVNNFRNSNNAHRYFLSEGIRNFAYSQYSTSETQWNSWSLSADYQRTFRRNREELLTFSYRLQNTPERINSWFEIPTSTGNSPFPIGYQQRNRNRARGVEHSGQVDYVNPLSRRHVIEVGARFIYRHNYGEGTNEFLIPENDDWQLLPMNSDLDHRQQITAGYAGYTFRADRFSVRGGLRAENTDQTITTPDTTFSTHFFNVVPSAAVSFQIRPTTTLRFNYSMRIQRPGIWQLNPFVNDVDPSNIHYGNPDLNPVNTHSFSLNFGHFAQRFNINASMHYNFSNNTIMWYSFLEDGVVHNTVGNIGTRQSIGFHLHGSLTPIQQLRINLNGGINYTEIQGGDLLPLSNSGIAGNVHTNITYTLPREWRIGFNGGYFSPWIGLQTTGSAQHWHSFNVMRSFLNRRLDMSLNVNSPFQKSFTFRNETIGEGFTQQSEFVHHRRNVNLSATWRFGELRTSARRVQRSIQTDDVMGGGQGGGESGGQQ